MLIILIICYVVMWPFWSQFFIDWKLEPGYQALNNITNNHSELCENQRSSTYIERARAQPIASADARPF